MGSRHGLYCVGCCWGLMLALGALGLMNALWMVLVAGAIFAEKTVPRGERIAPAIGLVLVAAGVGVALGLIPVAPAMGDL